MDWPTISMQLALIACAVGLAGGKKIAAGGWMLSEGGVCGFSTPLVGDAGIEVKA